MLIKINLSTRPFYNRSLIYSIYIVLIVGAIIFSTYNGFYIFKYFAKSKPLKAAIAKHNREINAAERKINAVVQQLERSKKREKSREIVFINNLINLRTFSWSKMLSNFEELLPPQVVMLSISPRIEEDTINLELSVASYHYEQLLRFIRNLEESPNFSNIYPMREMNEYEGTNMVTLVIKTNYNP